MFVVIGALFGILLTALERRKQGRLPMSGVWGSAVLLVVWLGIRISLGAPASSIATDILWFGILFMGWGWLLGRLLQLILLGHFDQ